MGESIPEKYHIDLIKKNLKEKYGRTLPCKREEYFLESEGKKIPIPVIGVKVYEDYVEKIAEEISKIEKISKEEVFENLTKRHLDRLVSPLRRALNYIIILLSIGLVALIISKTGLFTGFAINNISNTASNVGIAFCVLGILGLLLCKIRNK